MQAKSKLPGWCQLVLFGLCAMLAVTKVQAVHIGQDATPDDNDVLIDEISFQIGALDAAVVGGLLPIPGVGNAAEAIEYVTNLTLKATPPAFVQPGDEIVSPVGCSYPLSVPRTEDTYEDWFGFWTIDALSSNWGGLGQPDVRHANSTVVVSVNHPLLDTGTVDLPEGEHEFDWRADTQLSPWLDIIIPPALFAIGTYAEAKYGDAIAAKIAKKNARVARALKKKSVKLLINIAKAAGLQAIDYGLDAAIGDEVDSATNRATQMYTVWDIHTPFISTSQSDIIVEATDLGGTRFVRIEEQLVGSLDYGDDCNRPVRLIRNEIPNVFPVGQTTEVVWTVSDDGLYRSDIEPTSSISQFVTVEDTQPPILVAPDGFVRLLESALPSVTIPESELGRPMVIDLADPIPAIANDAPGTYPADTRTAVRWTATDASGNVDSKIQWITAKTTNTEPRVEHVLASSRTSEVVDIRLKGLDLDVLVTTLGDDTFNMADQLGFKIIDFPDNGEFVAPLRPFFIEDFRLTPIGETEVAGVRTSPLGALAEQFAGLPPSEHRQFMIDNFCSQNQEPPRDMVYKPSYVHVSDDGIYYVRDKFWDCDFHDLGQVAADDRISKWNADREFLGQYRVFDADNGLGRARDVMTVDGDGNTWWIGDEPSFGGSQFALHKVDANFGNLETRRFALSEEDFITLGRRFTHAVGDPENGLLYVHDNRGVLVYSFSERELLGRLTIDGEEFFHNVNNEFNCSDVLSQQHLRNNTFWMTLNRDGELFISDACQDRIYKFEASKVRASGDFVPGEFIGWMGRCSANILPWAGCNGETRSSHGFTCADSKCLREDGTAGSEPGQFDDPTHINIDPNGSLYVADYSNARVQRFGADGTFAGQAKSEGTGINQGEAPGFVLGNMGNPQAVSVNSSSFYVMERDDQFGDYFLHIFETLPFYKIESEGNDMDGDGYEDNVTLVKYVSRFNFPGGRGLVQGTDSFRYVATDGLADSNIGTVEVTVVRNFRPPEDLTIRCYTDDDLAERIPCVLDEDTDIVVELIAKDPDGIIGFDGLDTLSYHILNATGDGSLDLLSSSAAAAVYRYSPDPNFNGVDSLRYSVTDGVDTVQSDLLELTVRPVDDEPVFTLAAAGAARGFPGEVHITMSDIDAIVDERLPDSITFSWGNGVNEQPGEIIKNADDTYEETGPVFNKIAPGEYHIIGRPVYPNATTYDIVMTWQYDANDTEHDSVFHSVDLGSVTVAEATYVTITADVSEPEPTPDEVVSLTLAVENQAPEGWTGLTAVDVEATVKLPTGLGFGGVSKLCSQASASELRCALGNMGPGVSTGFPVNVLVNADAVPVPMHSIEVTVATTSNDVSLGRMTPAPLFVQWPDTDGDELPDDWEVLYGFDPATSDGAADGDTDGEGLSNFDEYVAATNPRVVDSDGDGLSDAVEVDIASTDPLIDDTDGDGLPDDWEYNNGLDAIFADAHQDADGDGLTNEQEFDLGTDPGNKDSDGDGHTDLAEAAAGMDPLFADTDNDGIGNEADSDDDNDGIPDTVENGNGLDDFDPRDALADFDGDGYSNIAEFQADTAIMGAAEAPQPTQGTPTLFASVLPLNRSAVVDQLVTAFATIINAGGSAAENCTFVPLRPLTALYSFQATDPLNNAIVGNVNEGVTLASGASQSYVFALKATAPLVADVELRFDCANTDPAISVSGINTFGFSASVNPTSDVIALGGTLSGDGTVHIDPLSGLGTFAVATVNVGANALVTMTTNSGTAALPLEVSVCRTDPGTGACIEPTMPASSVTAAMATDETQTYSIFISASGAVPFDPATNRIFVVFSEDGEVRGSTSVAVRTGE